MAQLASYPALLLLLLLLALAPLHPPFAAALADPPLRSPPHRKDIDNDRIKVRTVAIIIASLISFFFIIGCVSAVLTRRYISRQLALATTTLDLESHGAEVSVTTTRRRPRRFYFHRHVPTGLDPSIMDTFPTLVYSEVQKDQGRECAVCLSEFGNAETLWLLPKCCHVFHADCIETWLSIRVTCPVCRCNLAPKPDDDRLALVNREPEPEPEPESAVSVEVSGNGGADHSICAV